MSSKNIKKTTRTLQNAVTIPKIPIITNQQPINHLRKPINTNFPGSGDSAPTQKEGSNACAKGRTGAVKPHHRIMRHVGRCGDDCWRCQPTVKLARRAAWAGLLGLVWASQVSRSWKIGFIRFFKCFIVFYWVLLVFLVQSQHFAIFSMICLVFQQISWHFALNYWFPFEKIMKTIRK